MASDAWVRAPIERPVGVLLAVFGLCGFAVAQPLLDVLGRGATFFAAHQADRYDVVLFTVLVTVVPAVAVSGFLLAAYAVARSSWRVVVPLTFGFLTAAILVPHLDRAARLPSWVFVLVAMTAGTGTSILYWRYSVARAFARATAFAPIFFAALFLLSSPASTLVLPQSAAGPTQAEGDANVVLLVLDELPLGALVDRSGFIDEHRFPGFSRLAKESTWYRNATTITPWTYLAVPAVLTGSMPRLDQPPVEANYPRNVFRMLAESHVLHSHEEITFLCPAGKCHHGGDGSPGTIYRDAATVFLHGFLPDGLAQRWLPPVAGRWADFAGSEAAARDVEPLDMGSWIREMGPATSGDQVARFRSFLASIGSLPRGHAGLWVGHFLLPHFPVRYLPDGRAYDGSSTPPGLAEDDLEWSDDRRLVDLVRQRFLLQIKYVDTLVEQLLDRLSAEGMADDTLLVVTADHGLSFAPGSNRRGVPLTEKSAPEILPVPLFVKYPGEPGGDIDDQRRQIIDIMPTIAAAIDVDLPDDWQFDGRSLRGEPGDQRRWLVPETESGISPPPESDLEAASSGYLDQFGEGRAVHDIFASEPFGVLVGTATRDLEIVEVPDPPTARLLTTGFADFDPEKRSAAPVLARFSFGDRGRSESGWLAVALNGTIAGVGPIYQEGRSTSGIVMLDPALLRPGPNTVEPFLVIGEGRLARTG